MEVVIINNFSREVQCKSWELCSEIYHQRYEYLTKNKIYKSFDQAKKICAREEEKRLREILISQIRNKKQNNSMKKEVTDEMKHNINEVREADRINKKEAPNDDEDEYILRAQLLAQISKKMSAKENERTKSDEVDDFVLEVFIRKEDMDFIEKDKTEVAIKTDKCMTQIKKPELRTQQREPKSENKVRRRSPSPRRGDNKRRRQDLEKPEFGTQPRDTKRQYYRVRSKRSRSPSPRRGDNKRMRPLKTEQERRDRERRERKERDRIYKLRADTWRSKGY